VQNAYEFGCKKNGIKFYVNFQSSTTLGKLGWLPVTPKEDIKVNKKICSFSVGIEKYLAMEALFNLKIMRSDVRR
jgi:hypothetical protein